MIVQCMLHLHLRCALCALHHTTSTNPWKATKLQILAPFASTNDEISDTTFSCPNRLPTLLQLQVQGSHCPCA